LEWKSLARPDRNPIYGLAAIGGSGKDRVELQEFMRANGLLPVTAVHPTAFVARDAEIGESCQILAHAAICAEAVLGASCIVNSSATVEHECNLGVGVHIGPGAKLAGLVEIDEFTFVGAGAVVLPRVRIGRNVIVGAGAVVTKDIADNLTVVGNPARPLSHGESQ
jgi:sugar O-acyltransferase (sialic acid O-acetyltransferase NeuD family)